MANRRKKSDKKRFRVTAEVTISVSTVVMAGDEAEAVELAESRRFCSLIDPAQMGDDEDDCWVHSGEIDGMLNEVEAELEE